MNECMTGFPRHVTIREVGPREGFQILKKVYPTELKIRLIEALLDAGLKTIEVTSFVRQDLLPQMADADQLVAALPRRDDCKFTALYLNPKGFERAEATGRLANEGWLYTSTSDSFLRANNNCTIDDTVTRTAKWIDTFRLAQKELHGLMVSTAFGCNYEGEIDTDTLRTVVCRFIEACAETGASLREVCLADTIGRGNPLSVTRAVDAIRSLEVDVSLHLHDTWGMGLVNVFAGLRAGVTILECSVGGVGGCPFTPGAAGNVATEDVVYLCNSLGIETGIDLEKCCRAAQLAEQIIGQPIPGRVFRGVLGL